MHPNRTLLLQKDVFSEDALSDTERMIREAFSPCPVEVVCGQEVMMGSARLRGHTGPFRGSLTMAQRMGRNLDFANARHWGPALRQHLLSKDYYFLDAASVLERFPRDRRLFVRPAAGLKEFAGGVFSRDKFAEEFNYATQGRNVDPCTICMVATPCDPMPEREWRVIFLDHTLVGASQYMDGGALSISGHVPDEVLSVAGEVAKDSYFLNVPSFVLDFAAAEGGPKLIEVNAFETSSFYGADLRGIYRAWGESLAVCDASHPRKFASTDLLEKAIPLAARAHAGQVDKAGMPYILHSLRVMLRLGTVDEMCAGVLHDVVEDTPVSLEVLRGEGFPDNILAAVDALTKRQGESRIDAARRAADNPIARKVKLADNADNMDLGRLPSPTAKDLERLEEYRRVRELLEEAERDRIPGLAPAPAPAPSTTPTA